jgi:hypothetical protein
VAADVEVGVVVAGAEVEEAVEASADLAAGAVSEAAAVDRAGDEKDLEP